MWCTQPHCYENTFTKLSHNIRPCELSDTISRTIYLYFFFYFTFIDHVNKVNVSTLPRKKLTQNVTLKFRKKTSTLLFMFDTLHLYIN